MLKRNKPTLPYERLNIPHTLLGPTTDFQLPTVAGITDSKGFDKVVFFTSLFLREFTSTLCHLILSSRLGGDLFIAGPVVLLYINIVFRRPLINPFVTTLACWSTGDWKKANVAGYPGYSKSTTHFYELPLFSLWLIAAQLTAAVTAGYIRAYNDSILGFEFIKNAAWGSSQMYFKANLTEEGSCWNKELMDIYPYQNTTWGQLMEIPVHMYKQSDKNMYANDNCLQSIQWRWWFIEDMAAVLFLIVGYIHIWRWLRWDDMQRGNPNPRMESFWGKIVSFSIASGSLAMMTSMAFPTAHAGLHTSLFLYVYEDASVNKHVASNKLNEPWIRAFGGICGCFMAMLYEWAMSWLDSADSANTGQLENFAHKLLYVAPIPEQEKSGE